MNLLDAKRIQQTNLETIELGQCLAVDAILVMILRTDQVSMAISYN